MSNTVQSYYFFLRKYIRDKLGAEKEQEFIDDINSLDEDGKTYLIMSLIYNILEEAKKEEDA